jgi:hypothetical protein
VPLAAALNRRACFQNIEGQASFPDSLDGMDMGLVL